jgi:hypothetical protein
VLIVGGDNEGGAVSEAEALDPVAKTLSVVARALVPRTRHTATRLTDGRVLISGGLNQAGLLASTEIFDPMTDSFSEGPRLRRARAGHTATLLDDGRVLIAGGREDSSAEIFDPFTSQSIILKDKMVEARKRHSAIALKDGNVLLAGGEGADGHNLESAEVFDPRTSSFSATANRLLIPRAHPTLSVLPDGKVQVIGGDYEGTMEVYDPASGRFGAVAHLVPTADIFPQAQMLSARTRASFFDSINYRDSKTKRQHSASLKSRLEAFRQQEVGRSHYATAEIPGLNQTVIAGGVGDDRNLVRSALLLPSSAATVSTGKVEYQLGEAPVITGTGWHPGEVVTVIRQEARLGHKRTALRAVADEQGNFICADLRASDYQIWVTYTLTAEGQTSGQIAQTTYFDAPPSGKEWDTVPKNLKFEIPILTRDGSVETETVLLKWRSSAPADSALTTSAATCAVPTGNTFNFNADFSSILNQPCLGIDGNPCGAFGDVRLKEGCLAFSGSIRAELCIDITTITCTPYAKFSVQEDFIGRALLEVDLNDNFILPVLNIPIPGAGGVVAIPGLEDAFQATLGLTVRAKIEAMVTTPAAFEVTVDWSQGAEVGVDTRLDPAFFNTETTPPGTGSDVQITELGEASAKVKIGPNVGLLVTAGPITIMDFGLGVLGFVEPGITGVTNTATCKSGQVDLFTGVDGDATARFLGLGTKSTSLEFFRVHIPGFPKPFVLADTEPPTIAGNTIVLETAPGQCSATVADYGIAVLDDCSGIDAGSLMIDPLPGSTFPKGVTTVTVNVKDNAGNLASGSFTVTVNDTEAPTITSCPGDITQGTDPGQCSAAVNFTPAATDNCDGSFAPNCSPPSGSAFPKGTTTVSCTATDQAGNASSPCSFTVAVNDVEKPVITGSGNITQGTDANQCTAVVNFTTTATDNCDSNLTPTCTPPSGSTFPKGATTVNCSVSDAAGNQATALSFTVTINDTEKPSITCPANISVPTVNNTCSAPVSFTATASDNCDGTLTPDCTPQSGSTFPKGVTTVNCTVKDSANNSISCSFTVTVNDTENPSITCPPDQVRNNDLNQCGAIVNYSAPQTSDNCAVMSVVCLPASESFFPVGMTTVNCLVKDTSNNQAACSFTLTVIDAQLPVITPSANITHRAARPGDAAVGVNYASPSASDNCAVASVVCAPPSGAIFPVGVTTVSCTAADPAGNKSSYSFTVTVFDICLQDDSNPSAVILVNSATGDYRFCHNGTTYTGKGTMQRKGSIFTLLHNSTSTRVKALVDAAVNRGTASLQNPTGILICTITDRNIRDNSCQCGVTGP